MARFDDTKNYLLVEFYYAFSNDLWETIDSDSEHLDPKQKVVLEYGKKYGKNLVNRALTELINEKNIREFYDEHYDLNSVTISNDGIRLVEGSESLQKILEELNSSDVDFQRNFGIGHNRGEIIDFSQHDQELSDAITKSNKALQAAKGVNEVDEETRDVIIPAIEANTSLLEKAYNSSKKLSADILYGFISIVKSAAQKFAGRTVGELFEDAWKALKTLWETSPDA